MRTDAISLDGAARVQSRAPVFLRRGGEIVLGMNRKSASGIAFSMSVMTVMVLFAPMSALATEPPESYTIDGVPLYQQIDAKGCGPVALQMVFDYFGEFVEQKEIYNAARAGGTPLPDMARAAHFSDMSTTEGDRWTQYIVTGYTARSIGYAGFYFAASEEWMDGLKAIVAQGYPVAVLQNFYPDSADPHYRVVVGYDEVREVFIVNDGWSREFKVPSGYQGSTSTSANPNAWDDDFTGMEMSYADFELAWQCPTDVWGVPLLKYGAVMAAPWEVELSGPSTAAPGEEVSLDVNVLYPCVEPFGTIGFPTFDASGVTVQMRVMDESGELVGEAEASVDLLLAGESLDLTLSFVAPSSSGELSLEVWATGLVSGDMEPWKDYPAYQYTDLIGGSATTVIDVV